MKVCLVSLDQTILDKDAGGEPDSPSFRRLFFYAQKVDELDIIVLAPGRKRQKEANKIYAVCFGGSNKVFSFWRTFWGGLKLVREKQPRVISAQDPFFTGLLAWLFSGFCVARLLVELHGDFWTDRKDLRPGFVRKLIAKFVLTRASRIRVVSNRVKRGLLREFPSLAQKEVVVFPVVSGEAVYTSGPRPDWIFKKWIPNSSRALFVGRLTYEKGLDWFLPVFAEVCRGEQPISLLVVGVGPEEESLKASVKKLGIDNYVIFEGEKPEHELIDYYHAADFLILPSRQESWGRVVIEALQSGSPALVTAEVGAAEDLLSDGVSALVVPFGNNAAMKESLRKMITDRMLRKRLAEAGRRAVSHLTAEFSRDKMINFWMGV